MDAKYFSAPGFNHAFTPEEYRKLSMEKLDPQIIAVQTSATFKTWLNPDGRLKYSNFI